MSIATRFHTCPSHVPLARTVDLSALALWAGAIPSVSPLGAVLNAGEPGRKFLLKTIGRRDGAVLGPHLALAGCPLAHERTVPSSRYAQTVNGSDPLVSHHCCEPFRATHKIRQFPCVRVRARRAGVILTRRREPCASLAREEALFASLLRLPPVRAHTIARGRLAFHRLTIHRRPPLSHE